MEVLIVIIPISESGNVGLTDTRGEVPLTKIWCTYTRVGKLAIFPNEHDINYWGEWLKIPKILPSSYVHATLFVQQIQCL